MNTFTRYLLRSHLGPFFFAFAALTGVILINTFARQMAELAGKGLPLDVVFMFFVYSLPSNVALALPMAVLVSVLYTFSRLASDNEIAALRAGGIDLRRTVAPLLVAAACVAGGMSWFNSVVLPESNHSWKQLMIDIGRTTPLIELREQSINELRTGQGSGRYYLQAARIDATASRLYDVVIHDRSQRGLGRTIYADSGLMQLNPAQTDLLLTLFDGHVNEVRFDDVQDFQRVYFNQQLIRMPGIGTELERQAGGAYRSDREMTLGMLRERVSTLDARKDSLRTESMRLARVDLERRLGTVPDTLPSEQAPELERMGASDAQLGRTARLLRSQTAQLGTANRQSREYRIEIHKKFAIATAPLVFVLLGAPFAVRFPSGGVGVVIATSLTIFALYYVGLIGGETLASEGYVSPIIAMWAMNVLILIPGLWAFARMGREVRTNRSGGSPFQALRRLWRRE